MSRTKRKRKHRANPRWRVCNACGWAGRQHGLHKKKCPKCGGTVRIGDRISKAHSKPMKKTTRRALVARCLSCRWVAQRPEEGQDEALCPFCLSVTELVWRNVSLRVAPSASMGGQP